MSENMDQLFLSPSVFHRALLEKIKRIDPERRKKILGEIESWQNRNTEAENV